MKKAELFEIAKSQGLGCKLARQSHRLLKHLVHNKLDIQFNSVLYCL